MKKLTAAALALLICAASAGCASDRESSAAQSVISVQTTADSSAASSEQSASESAESVSSPGSQSSVPVSTSAVSSEVSSSGAAVSSEPVISEPEVSSEASSEAPEPVMISEPEVSEPESSAPASSSAPPPAPEPPPSGSTWPYPLNDVFDEAFFKDDLFIGDSIYTGLYLYGHISRELVAAKIGYTTYAAQTQPFDDSYYSGSAVDYAKKRAPKRIIVMLGSNSLSAWTDFDDFEYGYRGLLTKLISACPNSRIVAVSVPPVTADSSLAASYSHVNNKIIDTANERIKSLCSEYKLHYFDLNSRLKNASGCFSYDYAEMDGLHFKGYTYKIMLGELEDFLKKYP